MRMLSVAMLAVGMTGLLGAAEVRAQAAMSMSSCGSGASAGAAGAGSVGGWSLAPEAPVKRKPTSTSIKLARASVTSVTSVTSLTTTAGAWSVAPAHETIGEPVFGNGAPESKSQAPAGTAPVVSSAPAAAARPVAELNGAHPAPEPADAKTSKK